MTEENQSFNYDTFIGRLEEQSAKLLHRFAHERRIEEHDEVASLFHTLTNRIKTAQFYMRNGNAPEREGALLDDAAGFVLELARHLKKLDTSTAETFERAMSWIDARYSELVEQHPEAFRELLDEIAKVDWNDHPPDSWREEFLKKRGLKDHVSSQSDKPSEKKRGR